LAEEPKISSSDVSSENLRMLTFSFHTPQNSMSSSFEEMIHLADEPKISSSDVSSANLRMLTSFFQTQLRSCTFNISDTS